MEKQREGEGVDSEEEVEKRMMKKETEWKIVWVCNLCLGSSVSPREAAH